MPWHLLWDSRRHSEIHRGQTRWKWALCGRSDLRASHRVLSRRERSRHGDPEGMAIQRRGSGGVTGAGAEAMSGVTVTIVKGTETEAGIRTRGRKGGLVESGAGAGIARDGNIGRGNGVERDGGPGRGKAVGGVSVLDGGDKLL